MKYIFLVLLNLFLLQSTTKATEPELYIRPGIKFGYQFGDNGGFVYGFELGLINYKNNYDIQNNSIQTYLFGLLSSIEFCNGNRKVHFGLELSDSKVAIEIGPSLYNFNDENYIGLTCGVNSLLIVSPYIEYNKIFNNEVPSFFQTGSFLKASIPFGNKTIRTH